LNDTGTQSKIKERESNNCKTNDRGSKIEVKMYRYRYVTVEMNTPTEKCTAGITTVFMFLCE
jgi:hypothetical protein